MSDSSGWEPKRKIVQMALATAVGITCLVLLVWGPEAAREDFRGVLVGLATAAFLVVGIGATRAAPLILLACLAPVFINCAGLPEIVEVEGDISVVGEPTPISAAMGVTLTGNSGELIGIGTDFTWVEPVSGTICIEYLDEGTARLSVCVYCDQSSGCSLMSLPASEIDAQ